MTRKDDRFFIEHRRSRVGGAGSEPGAFPWRWLGRSKRATISVDRVVGSHWLQQGFPSRPERPLSPPAPLVYHIVEKRWIHLNGALSHAELPEILRQVHLLECHSCLFCHNTRPAGTPYPLPNQEVPGYNTTVGELGISCETCHGASERHVRAQQNPARRLAQFASEDADPTIVNPARLSVPRSDDVCAPFATAAPIIRMSTVESKDPRKTRSLPERT